MIFIFLFADIQLTSMCMSRDCIIIESIKPAEYKYERSTDPSLRSTNDQKKAGCIISYQNRYLLVQVEYGIWGFPKGSCEDNETLTETAIREVKEETSLDVSGIIQENGFTRDHCTLFFANLKENLKEDDLWKQEMKGEITGIAFVCKDCLYKLKCFNRITRSYFETQNITLERNERLTNLFNKSNRPIFDSTKNGRFNKPCEYGRSCDTSGCRYEHNLCKFGNRCNRRETCRFVHLDSIKLKKVEGKPCSINDILAGR